jgi:hypothetical protein
MAQQLRSVNSVKCEDRCGKGAMCKEAVVANFMKYILELSHKKVRQNKWSRIYDHCDENGTQDLPTTQLECQHEILVS